MEYRDVIHTGANYVFFPCGKWILGVQDHVCMCSIFSVEYVCVDCFGERCPGEGVVRTWCRNLLLYPGDPDTTVQLTGDATTVSFGLLLLAVRGKHAMCAIWR